MDLSEENTEKRAEQESQFKKPILVGKIGKLPKKIAKNERVQPVEEPDENLLPPEPPEAPMTPSPAQNLAESQASLPYKEPSWSGIPHTADKGYSFEVLKNGAIIETVDLMEQPFWVFGRLANCDICMQHPTISRYHAVLQYRSEKTETEDCGFYIYDLGSTHGTFLNKNRLKSRVYARIQVGHMLKLGCSTRTYILNGPEEDSEEESPLTVTELYQKREEELRKRQEEEREAELEAQRREEEAKRREEERGIDWGMGEDAEEDDEEGDLSENPYAQANNEELYLDDPKKALRGFFEREGLDLEYDCSEQGFGQFVCRVELPIDDELGRPIVAEVTHKGKKKEAVVQCALEACRIIDRHGLLRQATHESRKRKPKNWEENDYYDSDDDTFLDRTGAIEKKREMRMKAKLPPKAETYESLVEKENAIRESILKKERELADAQSRLNSTPNENPEQDSLDSFMQELKQAKPDKLTVNKLKSELIKLRQEHASIVKLVNIAKPASLPPLLPETGPSTSAQSCKSRGLPIFGKRKKIKLDLPKKESTVSVTDDGSGEEKEDEEEEGEKEEERKAESAGEEHPESEEGEGAVGDLDSSSLMTFKKFEKLLERQKLPAFADRHVEKLTKIMHTLKKLATDGDRMDVDWKMLEAKKRKVLKLIQDMKNSEPNEKLEFKVSSELTRILNELNTMTEQKFKVISKVKRMGNELKIISDEINSDLKKLEECEKVVEEMEDAEKRKKKNLRRIQQRQGKAELEKQKGYDEDAQKEDYNMWVPPTGQSGDGRTSLNDKFGY